MNNPRTLTLEEIDARMLDNNARLEIVSDELETNTAELGSARGWKLSTIAINKKIDQLEHECRELIAEQKYLNQERENILKATKEQAAQKAATEYMAMLEQLNPRGAEIIKSLYVVQTKLIELEKLQNLMTDQAAIAGKLVNPALLDGKIIIDVALAEASVQHLLSRIIAFTGKASVESAGIRVIDLDEERQATFERLRVLQETPVQASPNVSGTSDSMRQAAGLNYPQPEIASVGDTMRKGAGLPVEKTTY